MGFVSSFCMAINRACLADTELVSIALGIDDSKKAK